MIFPACVDLVENRGESHDGLVEIDGVVNHDANLKPILTDWAEFIAFPQGVEHICPGLVGINSLLSELANFLSSLN